MASWIDSNVEKITMQYLDRQQRQLAERLADPMPNLPVRYKQSRTLVSESLNASLRVRIML